MSDYVSRIGLFNGISRPAETGRQIAVFLRLACARIAVFEHDRRVLGHGEFDKRHMRQYFVLHLDETRCVVHALFGIGGNRSNRVPLVHDLGARLFEIECGFDAGRFLRFGEVDGDDACVRMRRPDHLAVDHSGTVDVEGVFRAASDFVRTVKTFYR